MYRALICIVLICGCGTSTVVDVPIAVLKCPRHVEVNETFTIDGSASVRFTTAALTVEPGGHAFDTPSTEIAIPAEGIVTATLVVDGGAAQAVCRIAVGDVALPGDDVPPGPNLSGTFAMIADDFPELSDSGVLDPETQCPSAPVINLVRLEQSGTRVTMTAQTCVMKMPPVQIHAWLVPFGDPMQRYTVPDHVIDLLPPYESVELEIASGAFAIAGTARHVIGAGPDGTPRDDDNDTRPGVTIEGTSGLQDMIYRRALGALDGTIVDDNRIEGTYVSDQEASLLGFFAFLDPQARSLPSTFVMHRIDDFSVGGAPITCAEVRAHKDDLFALYTPPTPPEGCAAFQ